MTSQEALEAIKPPLWALAVFALPVLFDLAELLYNRITENGGDSAR